MRRSLSGTMAMALLAATIAPYHVAQAATPGVAWTANGGTACAKYLTPAVTGAILNSPAGAPQKNSESGCLAWPLFIKLKPGNAALFRSEIPRIAFSHPIGGIGEAAFWNDAGVTASVKGDRECDIGVMLPNGAKLSGAALSQKLGAVCNLLFALP